MRLLKRLKRWWERLDTGIKLGDRVVVKSLSEATMGPPLLGEEGVVISELSKYSCGVEFDNPVGMHDLGGACAWPHGKYIMLGDMRKVWPDEDWEEWDQSED